LPPPPQRRADVQSAIFTQTRVPSTHSRAAPQKSAGMKRCVTNDAHCFHGPFSILSPNLVRVRLYGNQCASQMKMILRATCLVSLLVAGYAATAAETDSTNQFRKVVLAAQLNDPMELSIAPDGRVFYIERSGALKVWKPDTKTTVIAGRIPVAYNYNIGSEAAKTSKAGGWEDGLIGIQLDPDFAASHAIYLYYSPIGVSENRLCRFTMNGDTLDLASEKKIIGVETEREVCCHSAGSVAFDAQKNIYVSTGDNTNPFESDGYAPIDWRPGRRWWDAARSSGNRNDLRGKILRIKPKPEGGYTIPEGNLFPADGSKGRPEIYTMGHRNPFRISIDQETGWLYWGDVGPDAREANDLRGPAGFDEFNQARGPGNYGWPFFVANNRPYRAYDFNTKVSGLAFDPQHPVNNSPKNTGLKELPPAQGSFIAYPYAASTRYPELGSGGRSAAAGPVYHFDANLTSEHKLPKRYDKSLFIYDWMRNWIKEVRLTPDGKLEKINPFAPEIPLAHPIEMELGPDGCLYMIEFGSGWERNKDSQLIRIEYNGPK
jgi:cytochrome c